LFDLTRCTFKRAIPDIPGGLVRLTPIEFLRLLTRHCSGHEKYISAYDCQLKREILFRIFPHHLPADNPQQAESSSGIGGNGNLNCIRDKSGGTKEQKESNEGYHALFLVSNLHDFVYNDDGI
jgi:hypothetical protein